MSAETQTLQTRCLVVSKTDGIVSRKIDARNMDPVSDDLVRIKVEYSSINYKDALCANAHPGIARKLPIVPGIDAAGCVISDPSGQFSEGDDVMVFHAEFGTKEDGGLSQIIDVPRSWVYPIPQGLNARDCMIIGTAGFTAAQCVDELIKHSVNPDSGEIVVTGSTGGVGIFAIKLLSKLGYKVTAVTGKQDRISWLERNGASQVVGRSNVNDETDRPLLGGRWAGAVDTVGGNILATILRSTKPQGCVTACGLVAGVDFGISVYPFILRGVTLQGVDTAGISREYRTELWRRLAGEWAFEQLDELVTEVTLDGVEEQIQTILEGKIVGRVIVKLQS